MSREYSGPIDDAACRRRYWMPALVIAGCAFAGGTEASAAPPNVPPDVHVAQTNGAGTEDVLHRPGDAGEGSPRSGTRDQGDKTTAQGLIDRAHEEVFLGDRFPSATVCRQCHPKHFREWSVSQHAYAQLSPVFNAMHGTILKLTNGTNGDFCIRCHTQVGMILGESTFMSNIDRQPISREGVTCIVCHRVDKAYGKVSGRLAIAEGGILEPVYGPTGNAELKRVLANRNQYRVVTDPDQRGRKIHTDARKFFQITQPSFCGRCHDVTLVDGFRLEEAFSEYKNSPAARRGTTCQDCHMGSQPGVESGYDWGSAALVGGVPTTPRKLTNHYFAGPDFSVLHPGIFPHNPAAIMEESQKDDPTAQGLATIRQWLTFDHRAGWGTDEFEDTVPEDFEFPERWRSIDDRYDAREIVEENLELLAWGAEQRSAILKVGYRLGEIETVQADPQRIRFRVQVTNGTDGHGVPTGFDAERLVWLQVTVTDRHGKVVMQSGDLDPNGDVRDLHSLYVHNGERPLDRQLFSLQSRFLTTSLRGGEREQILAVNYSLDPLPFLRPETRSSVLLGRPAAVRKHKRGLAPLASRWANYTVDGATLSGDGPYAANVKLIAAMIPVNLISEIMHVGFDYNMTPRELADGVRDGHLVLWERNSPFDVHTPER